MRTRKQTTIIFLSAALMVVLSLLICKTVVLGSTLIQRVEIVSANWDNFPEITLKVNLLDEDGRPVTQFQPESLIVSEDNVNVSYTYQPALRGLKVVLVIDEGIGLDSPGLTGATRADEMKYTALRFLNSMQPADEVEILFVRGDSTAVIQGFSGNRDEVIGKINNWVYQRSYSYSFGLIGAKNALDHLTGSYPATDPRLVLFLSPGIQINKSGYLSGDIADKAVAAGIPFFSVLFNKDDAEVQSISKLSGGEYILYTSNDELNALFSTIDNYRRQYTFTYKTTSKSVSERTVAISTNANSAIAARDIFAFTVNPVPQPPLIASIVVNDENPIRRIATKSSDDMQSVPLTEAMVVVSIAWPDGYPARKLTDNKLIVNGAEFRSDVMDDFGNLTYTWDLRSYTLPGISTIQLQVYIKDDMGFEAIEAKSVSVEVIVQDPGNAICESLGKIPKIGDSVSNTCYQLGLTPSQILNTVLTVISLVLVVLLWVNRKTVVKVGQQTGAAVTQMINRVTQRYGGSKPKAKLELLAGGKEGQPAQYDLHGETPIGRDIEHAELIFDYPTISRSHCTIHMDKATGKWFIEDRDSANGTFLNEVKLEPFVETDLNNGDIIQLSQMERGGLRFRFAMAGESVEKKQPRPKVEDPDDTVEEDDPGEDVRLTHRVKRDRQTQRSIDMRARDDDHFDPSNPVF